MKRREQEIAPKKNSRPLKKKRLLYIYSTKN
jgi:hypothetical protein